MMQVAWVLCLIVWPPHLRPWSHETKTQRGSNHPNFWQMKMKEQKNNMINCKTKKLKHVICLADVFCYFDEPNLSKSATEFYQMGV